MNFLKAAVEDTDFRYTFSADIFDIVHIRAIRSNLNSNLQKFMSDIVDELNNGINEEFENFVTKGILYMFWLTQIGNQ